MLAIRRLAASMLIIQIIGPLNNQLDRVILTHLSTVEAVATYSLATQFYASALTVITSLFPNPVGQVCGVAGDWWRSPRDRSRILVC